MQSTGAGATVTTTAGKRTSPATEAPGKEKSRKLKKQATEKKKTRRLSMEFFVPGKADVRTASEIEKAGNQALHKSFDENKEQIAGFIGDPIACEFLHNCVRKLMSAGGHRFWIALEQMLQESTITAVALSRLGDDMGLSALPRKLEYFLRQVGGVANVVVAKRMEEAGLVGDAGAEFV